jgi:tellurite resistance protein
MSNVTIGEPGAPDAPGGRAPVRRLPPNLFAVSFGLAGVAETWSAVAANWGTGRVAADIAWIATALVWVVTLGCYLANVAARRAWRTELGDATFGPFVALTAIVPMLCGAALAGSAHAAGVAVWAAGLVATVGLGGWLSAEWIMSDLRPAQLHPGYFLPTVAGGFLAAGSSAQLGFGTLAHVMFGYGAICWLALGSILLQRLFTEPRLPVPLLPTMAIEVAPPVVAGAAWFAINGGRVDAVAAGLAGYAGLMVLVQVRLVALYRTVPFGPAWWAFTFSYAAVGVDGIGWLAHEHAIGGRTWSLVIAAVTTLAIGALLVRTAHSLARGRFLPPAPAPAPA